MTALNDSVPPKRDDSDFEQIYVKHYDFLVSIAVRKFGVPSSEADTLVQEVFLSYLKRSREIHDVHAWLSQRFTDLQQERQTRWQKLVGMLLGK